jgi:hypothetical protein
MLTTRIKQALLLVAAVVIARISWFEIAPWAIGKWHSAVLPAITRSWSRWLSTLGSLSPARALWLVIGTALAAALLYWLAARLYDFKGTLESIGLALPLLVDWLYDRWVDSKWEDRYTAWLRKCDEALHRPKPAKE